jgi:two-component system, chemotaxis family, chemotaxis protein CheY
MEGKRVLIADDTAFMRMTLRNVLEQNGLQVVAEAKDGEEAAELYAEFKPDVVTMDITMPNLDGISAVKKIVSSDPNARIIMVSAMGQKSLVVEALTSGAKDFIIKPFTPARVIEALKNAIS